MSHASPLRWHHNGRDGVSNNQPHHYLLNRLFSHRSKKTSKFRVTGLCAGNSPVTGEFPAQMASNAENVSIWWRHHGNWFFSKLVFQSLWSFAILYGDMCKIPNAYYSGSGFFLDERDFVDLDVTVFGDACACMNWPTISSGNGLSGKPLPTPVLIYCLFSGMHFIKILITNYTNSGYIVPGPVCNSNSMEDSLCCYSIPGHQIDAQFCTCHDNRAFVSCAKSSNN